MRRYLGLATACLAFVTCVSHTASADITQLEKDFRSPPPDVRPMVRWWWFGPAVTKEGIERELRSMKSLGYGGVEVQPTYPLALDGGEGATAVKNLKFMSPEFLEMLGFASAKCKELGLRMDLTLGSGWPYGGPQFTPAQGAKQLDTLTVNVPPGGTSVKPNIPAGRVLFAAFAGPAGAPARGAAAPTRGRGAATNADMSALKNVGFQKDGVVTMPDDLVATGGQVIYFMYRQSIMQVKRPALGAEGAVIDHLNPDVVDKFIKEIAEPEIKACGTNPPFAIFCDSLEINGENWTDNFLTEFQKRRGYDLTPYLPALIGNIGEHTDDIRHDYGQTVTDLFNENFNAHFQKLAKQYGTRFRIQGYGSPAATLGSFAFADLPEGELQQNFDFHQFRAMRYATSASHLLGQKVTSSEAFTWLHGAPFRATPMDIKGEVDQHFLDGINQIICHGWPYTPNTIPYPGASFYAAAVFNDNNPWSIALPDINTYIARTSHLLRAGKPVNNVAIYLPESDLYARAGTTFSSMNSAWSSRSDILSAILKSGNNPDAIDDALFAKAKIDGNALVIGDARFRAIILPPTDLMPLATARTLEAFDKAGGTVIAMQKAPARLPGVKASAQEKYELAHLMTELFPPEHENAILATVDQLPAALNKTIGADISFEQPQPAIGFVHRHTEDAEIYFIANTSNQPLQTVATIRAPDAFRLDHWDLLTGRIHSPNLHGPNNPGVPITLEPYGSTALVLTCLALLADGLSSINRPPPLDISTNWSVSFKGHPAEKPEKITDMPKLISWADLEGMQNFSGIATYEKKLTLTRNMFGDKLHITFGHGKPAPRSPGNWQGFAANYDAPVKDAAVVYINDTRAGAAWCEPFTVDITGLLKEGENAIRIDVANTAVNYLSATTFPNYNLQALRQAFGNRFDPQGTQLYAQPLPSGLQGPLTLDPQTSRLIKLDAPNPSSSE